MELTEREKAIVHEMYWLMNPVTKQVPFEIRLKSLMVMLKMRKIKITEEELKDLSHAIEAEQQLSIQEGFGFLNKHKDMLDAIKHFDF